MQKAALRGGLLLCNEAQGSRIGLMPAAPQALVYENVLVDRS
jgi:hypothetical protein